MKLSFAKEYHYIPNVTDEEILRICRKLGIPANDMEYDASKTQIERLKYNSELQLLGAVKQASISHAKILNDYDTTIEKYNTLIASLESKHEYVKDKLELEAIRDHLMTIRDNYSHVSTNLDVKSESLENYNLLDNALYDPTLSSYKRFKISFQNKLSQIRGRQLERQYEKLDDLTGLEYASKFTRKMNSEKILRVEVRILKLQQKQGKLISAQKRIITESSRKYIAKQAKELSVYNKNINREARNFGEMDDIRESIINTLIDERTKINEISRLTGKAGAEARVKQLELEVDRLEARVQSLQAKEGRIRAKNELAREAEKLRGLGA